MIVAAPKSFYSLTPCVKVVSTQVCPFTIVCFTAKVSRSSSRRTVLPSMTTQGKRPSLTSRYSFDLEIPRLQAASS